MYFPAAGIELNPLIPIVVGAFFGLVFGQVGLSGAFLILPFMVSALGFTSLSVRPTNLLINLIAPLGGVYGYFKEKRLSGLLAFSACVGGVPGSLLGAWIGLRFLKDPELFKVAVGLLLIGMASRLFYETTDRYLSTRKKQQELKWKFEARVKAIRANIDSAREAGITSTIISPWMVTIRFWDEDFSYNPALVALVGFFSAIFGVMTGMGAAFILVPIMTSLLGLPIYVVAGASLIYVYVTSLAGVISFFIMSPHFAEVGSVSPDLGLGALFGLGGFLGVYLSARMQKYLPENTLRYILGSAVFIWGSLYVSGYL